MTISDKVRQVAFTLAVGSVGAVLGYVGNDVVEIIGEMRQESAIREEYYKRLKREVSTERDIRYEPPVYDDPGFHCIGIGDCAF